MTRMERQRFTLHGVVNFLAAFALLMFCARKQRVQSRPCAKWG